MAKRKPRKANDVADLATQLAERKRQLEEEEDALKRLGGPVIVEGVLPSDRKVVYTPSVPKEKYPDRLVARASESLERLKLPAISHVVDHLSQAQKNRIVQAAINDTTTSGALSNFLDAVIDQMVLHKVAASTRQAVSILGTCSVSVRKAAIHAFVGTDALSGRRPVNLGKLSIGINDLDDIKLRIIKRDVYGDQDASLELLNDWLSAQRQREFPGVADKREAVKLAIGGAAAIGAKFFLDDKQVSIAVQSGGGKVGYFTIKPVGPNASVGPTRSFRNFPSILAR